MSGIRSSSCRRCHDSSKSQETKCELFSAALDVLTTRPTCHSSLASYLSSLGESLSSAPDTYGQSLEVLPSRPAASGSEAETRVHIPAHGGPGAQNELPGSILSHESKPLEKHRPPPPQSVWSPDELSYPP
ncbi:hypothetical protein Tco_1032309 [Tanacetum coccineum]|uniref:Uncharacterized protein n=1 Tax=Tanacetum coccineum TaxID=301880 RepID=A0ABQ5GCJ5_9ASTR